MVFQIYLSNNQLSSNSQNAITLAKSKALGEFKQGKVIYSTYEALYLIETKKAELRRQSGIECRFLRQNKLFALVPYNHKITQKMPLVKLLEQILYT